MHIENNINIKIRNAKYSEIRSIFVLYSEPKFIAIEITSEPDQANHFHSSFTTTRSISN